MHNPVQAIEKMMVEFREIVDKQSQQRRWRVDGASRSIADRSAVEERIDVRRQAAYVLQVLR